MEWDQVRSESMAKRKASVIGAGKFLRLVQAGPWEYVERVKASGVVAIIAVTAQQELVLTEQFRPAVQANVIDLPAGLAGDIEGAETEELVEAARRELEEETGYTAPTLRYLFRCPSSPGLSSEMIDYFLGFGVEKTTAGGGAGGEKIDPHAIPLATLREWLGQRAAEEKVLVDPKVYVALAILRA
jgi:ADP-ribose pyrophosphatase